VGPRRNAQSHSHRRARVWAADPGQYVYGYRYDQDGAENKGGCDRGSPLHSEKMMGGQRLAVLCVLQAERGEGILPPPLFSRNVIVRSV
jgi:hypothetical protein